MFAWTAIFFLGCGQGGSDAKNSSEHAHDEDDVLITAEDVARPASYADALSRIQGYRDTIRDSIAAGKPGKAHRPLDELNFVLEWLPEIASESNIPRSRWAEINQSAQQLRDLFDLVHAQIDANEAPDYAVVSKEIEVAIKTLTSVSSTESTPESNDQP